ncbi:flagellar biosynthesis anti-sigma factor FlgM [Pseudomonas oligotrophica]|uniref:flagellar biosynthesis anti-sigma factor FlgM n=1 Tax=Pseudomonas oligotrophica TaxID=2912055 RepID=UPI001F01DE76|nr:flagellar biosynthesis anti-sigma factor FlgM [Pseudomonas oligotrophica]MCF7200607.1 flagellar biosynthesis anti-sigma factor FlgM [Pseudomonas oligotrophica]
MEISRHFKPAINLAETTAPRQANVAPASPASSARGSESLPLEQLHDALRAMPEVDLERVAALKQALASGELGSDSADLAASMLSYHRGTDA